MVASIPDSMPLQAADSRTCATSAPAAFAPLADPRGARTTTARGRQLRGYPRCHVQQIGAAGSARVDSGVPRGSLADLVQRVDEVIDRFRAGETDAFEADQVIFQYSRSAKELWKFCNAPDVKFTAQLIQEREQFDWWAQGAPRSK